MTCRYIGEQTDGQGERFGEYAHNLDEREQGYRSLEEHRDIGPEYFLPIFAVTEHIDCEERYQCQEQRHGYIAGNICSGGEYGYQPHYVAQQYEEEYGEQQRGVPLVLLAYRRLYHIIHNHGHYILHKPHESAGSRICGIPMAIPAGRQHHDQAKQQTVNHDSKSHLGK